MPNDPEVKLTDEVAPDLSIPVLATVPASTSKPFPIVTLILLVISIGAIAATYFFYQQTKSLNLQLTQITQTLQQQAIKENQVTVTPQAKPDLAPPDNSTISATTTIVPTPTVPPNTNLVWDAIDSIMTTAQQKYPSAQLILVKTENAGSPTQVTKYWFRQNTTDRKYLYLLREASKNLSLVDQNVTVYETNLLPSLNSQITSDQLDLDEAITIATAACPTTFDCVNTPITGQYVKSGVALWQVTYKPIDNKSPFVVQIDATTKKILYKSL